MTGSRYRSPWEAPDCVGCGALHIYVDRYGGGDNGHAWRCFKCGRDFDAPATFRARRDPGGATAEQAIVAVEEAQP